MTEQKVTKIDLLLALMSDGEWHYPSDLLTVSHRFGDTMHRAKEKGYLIEIERIKGNLCRYRLIGHEDSRLWSEFLKKQSKQMSQLGTSKCPNLEGYRIETISGGPHSNTISFELQSPSGHQQHLTISSPGILRFLLE
ncbi:hypothetical protein NG796_09980 [Laspinema sp. A4]|uniref:hypothetical protein n=1 Tax=Laspinema sp. D2d TaxID=2953686 RepID=UPI0021BA4CEE|nr:hypothetical protein [Laspinema sp. D2d]MCT7983626.1 hypothetical protein [Laspinema sp. D2d]